MTTVVIGITTFRRPVMLEAALRSLEKLDTNCSVRVLVADNDPIKRDGVNVVDRVSASYRFPIVSTIVEEQGFTYGRNAILGTALCEWFADFVVTMDDDQLVEPQWLSALLEVQAHTGADLVGPAVVPAFDIPPPRWALQSGVYSRNVTTTGSVQLLYGDGGVLFSKSLVQFIPPPWYDHSFALTGGADAELFRRLMASGARFARAAEAVIHECYPSSRVTVRWALQRAYRIGSTDMLIAQKHGRQAQDIVMDVVRIVGALAISPVLFIIFTGQAGRQVAALCKFSRACGKIAGILGFNYREYTTIHGC